MTFYFNITFNRNGRLGGHNCTKFEIKDDFLILEGYDVVACERRYWRFKYELSEIKEFHIERMEEEDNKWI